MKNILKPIVPLGFLLVMLFLIFGSHLSSYNPMTSSLSESLQGPSKIHFLGTDSNGRDILSLILYGARLSLFVSIVVVFNCFTLGLIIGYFAANQGGWIDKFFLFVADVFQAFPGILLAIALAAFIPPSLTNLILLLSFVGWVGYARVVRAQVLELKTREFIQATKALGLGSFRRLFRHVLPNISGPLIVQASFGLAGVILAESSLSFLGLGLPAGTPSLGKLLDSGVDLLLIAPHVSLFPGAIIMFFVLVFNLVGDKLREKLV